MTEMPLLTWFIPLLAAYVDENRLKTLLTNQICYNLISDKKSQSRIPAFSNWALRRSEL